MATYTITSAQRAAHDKQLVASTVDVVNVTPAVRKIEVLSDGVAAIYFTVDGTVPTVGGGNTYKIPAGGASATTVDTPGSLGEQVQLISAGTPTYSVTLAG